MDHSADAAVRSPAYLPGVFPREMIEATLPLEQADPPEAGLRVSWCPGIPAEGENYHAHRLRAKIIAPDLADVFCQHCDPRMLRATIYDMFNDQARRQE